MIDQSDEEINFYFHNHEGDLSDGSDNGGQVQVATQMMIGKVAQTQVGIRQILLTKLIVVTQASQLWNLTNLIVK